MLHSPGAAGCGTWSNQGEHQEVPLPVSLDHASHRNCCFPVGGEGVFPFCSSDLASREQISIDILFLGLFSCWQVLLERWWLEVLWNLRIFLWAAVLWMLKSSRGRGIPSAAWAHFASWAALGTSATASSSHVTTLSFQVSYSTMKLCLRHTEGPAGSVFYGTREFLGWVLWSAKWAMSFSKELRVQSKADISTVPWIEKPAIV